MGFFGPRTTAAATFISPTDVSDLKLWLDSTTGLFDATSSGSAVTTDGSAVARWEDQSGGGNHATQSTSNNRPVLKTAIQNGKNVLRFDGSNDTMQISSIALQAYITVFVVSSTTRTGTNLKFWMEHGAGIGSNAGFFFNGTNAGAWAVNRGGGYDDGPSTDNADWIGSGWALAMFSYSGSGVISKNNAFTSGKRLTTGNQGQRNDSSTTAALNIGSRNQTTFPINGDIAEILIYNRNISFKETSDVMAYLNNKWSLY